MQDFCNAHHDWLTVVHPPTYASELKAAEGVRAHFIRDLGNLVVGIVDELATNAKRLLSGSSTNPNSSTNPALRPSLDPRPSYPRPWLCALCSAATAYAYRA